MKLSISNIAWSSECDQDMYEIIKEKGYAGIEIAPGRIFGPDPYKNQNNWIENFTSRYGLEISSIQSIWYGRKENLFSGKEEYHTLLELTKKVVSFASSIHCNNIVFGCPKGRNIPPQVLKTVAYHNFIKFGKEVSALAEQKGTVFAIEANPEIYGTNFITNTIAAVSIIKEINSPGCKLNLDIGELLTTIGDNDSKETNKKILQIIEIVYPKINHVHISEPFLAKIKERNLHKDLFSYLKQKQYDKYVSIEMNKQDLITDVVQIMDYIRSISNAV